MHRRLVTLVASAFALTLVLTGAAGVEPADAQPGPAKRDRLDKRDKREKVKQRVRIMRALVLAEELALDEATAGKLAPILQRFDDEIDKLLRQRVALRGELRAATDAGDERLIDKVIDKLVANQDARWDTERRRFADLRRLLTPTQTARLLDVLPEIDRRIMKGLRQQMAPHRPDRPLRRKGRALRQLPDDTPDNSF